MVTQPGGVLGEREFLQWRLDKIVYNFIFFCKIFSDVRSERGEEVKLMNPHIQELGEDVLYHLALGSGSHDLEKMFGDIKFVCMGGTPQRMKMFAGNKSRLLSLTRTHTHLNIQCFV